MAQGEVIDLAKDLTSARDRLVELAEKTRNLEEKKRLVRQVRRANQQIRRLISINIQKRGEAYRNATAEMSKANRKLRKAIKEAQDVADAIRTAAFALDLVAKLKPA